jgi:UDP-N-acetylglucosamine transferase subunit ALG13
VIFATTGTQTPFDRFVQAVDGWSRERQRDDVFIQIGEGEYVPAHADHVRFVDPDEYGRLFSEASLVVGHAGTGTILMALEASTPLVVMPRRAALRETRNDHQLATARRFAQRGLVTVAWDEQELPSVLDRLAHGTAQAAVRPHADDRLVGALRSFIDDVPARRNFLDRKK